MLETIWVLESAYQIERADLIETLGELLLMPVLQFEQREEVQAMLAIATDTNLDLPDALIAQSALQMGCDSVLTFDQKAARGAGFELLQILQSLRRSLLPSAVDRHTQATHQGTRSLQPELDNTRAFGPIRRCWRTCPDHWQLDHD